MIWHRGEVIVCPVCGAEALDVLRDVGVGDSVGPQNLLARCGIPICSGQAVACPNCRESELFAHVVLNGCKVHRAPKMN